MVITATAAVAQACGAAAVAAAVAATVTAAGEQKEYDDENPDHIVVIENIAKTIHNILHIKS